MSSILEFFFPNPEEMEANFQAMIVKEVLYKGKSFFNPIGQMNAAKLLTKVFLNGGYRAIKKQNTTIDLKDPENPV